MKKNDILLTILLLGDSSVGKTCLINRFANEKFEENFISTIGAELWEKSIKVNEKNVLLRIMDTCGQEKFKAITSCYYRNTDGIIFVYDVTNKNSFRNINKWLKDVNDFNNNFKGALAGNKIDLKDIRVINKEDMEKYADEQQIKSFEVSAKEGTNVEELFKYLAELIISNMTEEEIKKGAPIRIRGQSVKLKKEDLKQSGKKNNNCCSKAI